ncbi:SMI1/KNR4 family protein [Gilliamella sp. B2969]|uniref:SMI1/KNR4 family protein n=1 Tax=unclassified Gilliamella TaxID=2685620 RepID=UPI00226AB9F3|nr:MULTISPECIES: SMI1/KNR4 family protein [unclassified Gilliamella]MCX8729199.1 SMI1/KNR4 family protein [Gilliamella sp. B2969]MCX8738853.1 SMI1/KNR4 family protein [Gilliamella sp. B2824]
MFDKNNFYECEKKITIDNLTECENKLGIQLPSSLKQLYLTCNGGLVYKSVYKVGEPAYIVEISNFIPIKYNQAFKNDPKFVIEGIALQHWNEDKLPKFLLPFARSYQNGFLCINIDTGAIYQYLRSVWDTTLSKEQNFEKNSIYLSESLEHFLGCLTADEEDNDYAIEYEDIKPRESNQFYHSEKSIDTSDIAEIESILKIKIPEQLKAFLLKQNGGMPENNTWIDPQGEYDYVTIHELVPIKYYATLNDNKAYLMDHIAQQFWNRELLSKQLLPFANDAGGNYFCINFNNGKIYYCTFDTWSDNLSVSDNQSKSTLFLCNSFNEFMSKLICDKDLEDF